MNEELTIIGNKEIAHIVGANTLMFISVENYLIKSESSFKFM